MFGGLCFLVGGNMLGGVMGDEVIVRVGADGYDDALTTSACEGNGFHWQAHARICCSVIGRRGIRCGLGRMGAAGVDICLVATTQVARLTQPQRRTSQLDFVDLQSPPVYNHWNTYALLSAEIDCADD